jgi:hypothetical protein
VPTLLDIRTHRLVPGSCRTFDELVRTHSLPMLKRFGIRVVAHGPSANDNNSYYLIAAFSSSAQRTEQLDAFYGSDDWRPNRDAFPALIDTYHTVAVELTAEIREALIPARRNPARGRLRRAHSTGLG